ncbi:MAG: hypothetical protein IPJ71_07490 [Bdellovibrionales bacterium]|nr:hypothetical protein [Bdellovibrionales bacterium]
MFRLILMAALSLLPSATLGAQAGDRPPTNETGPCAKTLAKGEAASKDLYEAAPLAVYEAALRALEALNAEAESQLGVASDTAKEKNQTLLIKALRDRANEVLSASEYPSNDQRRGNQQTEVPQIVLTAFELARKLEFLQSQLSPHRLGSTWLQTIVPIDIPRSVLYERNDSSDTPSPVRRIEILAAKELLLYRGRELVSTLYGAVYLLSYKEGDDRTPLSIAGSDRKRLAFRRVNIPAKPSSQRAKLLRITELSKSLWEGIPEPSEGREVQVILISDSVKTAIPLAATTAATSRSKAGTREEEGADDFPDFFWNFVKEPLPY